MITANDKKKIEDTLKPCPFCGGTPHLDRHDIFCDCGVQVEIPVYVHSKSSVGGFPTYEEARAEMIEIWNRRVGEENE